MSWNRDGKSRGVRDGQPGEVVAIAGRRVEVRAEDRSVRVCHLGGEPCAVGDRVHFLPMGELEGRVVAVLPRERALRRFDRRGREEILAAWLDGLFIIVASEPPLWVGTVDRFVVAARAEGLAVVVVLNKVDLTVPAELRAELDLRASVGVPWLAASARTRVGLEALAERVAASERPWAIVGPSGTGKTSLVAALLPGVDVGAVAELSPYWGTGQHTTTGARRFDLPSGGAIVDAPGIRSFQPAVSDIETLRNLFPGIDSVSCRYRDCLHRAGEDGCGADSLPAPLLESYRRMLEEATALAQRARPW